MGFGRCLRGSDWLVLGMQHIRIFVPGHFSLFNYRFMRWFRWQAPLEPLLYGIPHDISIDSGAYSPMERVLVAGALYHDLQSTKSISMEHCNESCYKDSVWPKDHLEIHVFGGFASSYLKILENADMVRHQFHISVPKVLHYLEEVDPVR